MSTSDLDLSTTVLPPLSGWLARQDTEKVRESFAIASRKGSWDTYLSDASGDGCYALWLALMDRAMIRKVGIGYRDIEDFEIWGSYDSGMSPREAAQYGLECSDTYGYFFGEE